MPTKAVRLALTVALALPLFGQRPDYNYRWISLGFQKVEPAQVSEFLSRMREYSKPLYQSQVEKGTITSWKLFRVRYPNSDDADYRFVSMTEVPQFQYLDFPAHMGDPKLVLGEAKAAEMRKAAAKAPSHLVRVQELRLFHSTEGWSKADAKVLQVRYLKTEPGTEGDMVGRFREFWKPFYEDSVKAGHATAWAALQARFRGASDLPYGWITINGFGKLGDMGTPLPPEMAKRWGPRFRQLDLNRGRKLVKEELWELVEAAR
ncbi:MAG: hypothetical protein JNN08_14140 [Bryobacterales bacterium]|nr:hypothetical protein [Bryobacterales bacterium]